MIMIQTEILNGNGTGTLSHQRDIVFVSAKVFDMFLHPSDRLQLIIKTEVAATAIFLFELFMRKITEYADSVVGKDSYDPSFCQFRSFEDRLHARLYQQ